MRLVLCFLACFVFALAQEDIVRLDTGSIQGVITPQARAFRGVPYAVPPVGQLRWTDPQPAQSWTGVLNCQQDRAGCIQSCSLPPGSHACPPITSEDCLYLTIYTPRLAAMAGPAPIMVFFHGGNFFQGEGGGPLYDGSIYANTTGTILVAVNYRLGAMGFLSTGTPDVTGNFGIKDQINALHWVQRNGAALGGDINNVTIFGQSAGAISTTILMTSPYTRGKGLFHRAIIQSTPITIPLRDPSTESALASEFAKHIGCAVYDSVCLKGKNSTAVLTAQLAVMKDVAADPKILEAFLPWAPMVDGDIIPMQPFDALNQGLFDHGMPIIIGNVLNEGDLFIYEAFGKPVPSLEYDATLIAILGLKAGIEAAVVYPPGPNKNDTRPVLSRVATDYVFLCSNRNVTRAMAQFSPVYSYTFQRLQSYAASVWYPFVVCYDKVCHGSELPFVFGTARPFVTPTPAEDALSTTILTSWASFAATGNPNAHAVGLPSWPAYSSTTNYQTMKFDTPPSVISAYDDAACNFWDTLGYGY